MNEINPAEPQAQDMHAAEPVAHEQATPTGHDMAARLRDEAARRRVQAKAAKESAAAAEAEVAELRRQIAEMKLSQTRQQVQEQHPELTDDVLAKLCQADTPEALEEWAATYEQVLASKKAAEMAAEIQRGAVITHRAFKESQRHDGSSMSKPDGRSEAMRDYMRTHRISEAAARLTR